jgi:LPS O-antigen subunit length determinant protein (WzzB/FepE family)
MKKNLQSSNDEIHITELLESIWGGKKKISLIIFITVLISFGFNYSKPDLYSGTLVIKPSKNLEFVRFIPISRFFKQSYIGDIGDDQKIATSKSRIIDNDLTKNNSPNQINLINLSVIPILDRFIIEFMDYEELTFVISNNKIIKENISQLSKNDQQQILYDYAKLFTVEKSDPKEDYTYYTLNFVWHDKVEIKDILDQALALTIKNLEKSVFTELEDFLEIKKNSTYSRDLEKIRYLKEQSLIAKELGLKNLILDEDTLGEILSDKDPLRKKHLISEVKGYFLKGYRIIEKEIKIIENRKYTSLINIENEINDLKKLSINWVDYNIYLIDTFSLKNSRKDLLKSIGVGLIFGIFYVLLSNSFKSRKFAIKK